MFRPTLNYFVCSLDIFVTVIRVAFSLITKLVFDNIEINSNEHHRDSLFLFK